MTQKLCRGLVLPLKLCLRRIHIEPKHRFWRMPSWEWEAVQLGVGSCDGTPVSPRDAKRLRIQNHEVYAADLTALSLNFAKRLSSSERNKKNKKRRSACLFFFSALLRSAPKKKSSHRLKRRWNLSRHFLQSLLRCEPHLERYRSSSFGVGTCKVLCDEQNGKWLWLRHVITLFQLKRYWECVMTKDPCTNESMWLQRICLPNVVIAWHLRTNHCRKE